MTPPRCGHHGDDMWWVEVFRDTHWERQGPIEQASFQDQSQARDWVTHQLDRLRACGELVGGDDAAFYVAELSQPPHTAVTNAYLFHEREPIEWDDQSGDDDGRDTMATGLLTTIGRHPSVNLPGVRCEA